MANYSTTVGLTVQQIVPAATEPRTHLSIQWAGPQGSVWVSHLTTTPGQNLPGSYEVKDGEPAVWNSAAPDYERTFVPQGPVFAIAAQPPTFTVPGLQVALTVEAL